MKANAKYTVFELLTEAKVVKPETLVGKMRVRIGGVPVNKPAVLTIPAGTTKLDVLVGVDSYEIAFDGDNKDRVISKGAQEQLTAEGVETNKQVAAIQKAKAEALKAEKKPVK